jgi:hypothetical protein
MLGPVGLSRFERTLSFVSNRVDFRKASLPLWNGAQLNRLIKSVKRKAQTIDTIMETYRPFTYDYNYVFRSDNLFYYNVAETDFLCSPTEINWTHYWLDVHLPGLQKWCLPQLTAK